MNSSDGGVSGHVTVCVGMDNGVRVTWVVVENASVLNSGRCGEKEGDVRGLDRCDWCEGVVCTNEYDAKAYSGLGEVFCRVLCVESDEVVHGGSLGSHVCYKFLKLLESCHIFQNDDGGGEGGK